MSERAKCEICERSYDKQHKWHLVCSDKCLHKKNFNKMAKLWLEQKPKKKRSTDPRQGIKFAMSAAWAGDNDHISKRYTACRG